MAPGAVKGGDLLTFQATFDEELRMDVFGAVAQTNPDAGVENPEPDAGSVMPEASPSYFVRAMGTDTPIVSLFDTPCVTASGDCLNAGRNVFLEDYVPQFVRRDL